MSEEESEAPETKMVSQEVLRDRINAKNKEISMLKSELENVSGKARNYDAVSQERDSLKVEMTGLRDSTERYRSLNSLGIEESKHDGFKAIFDSEMAGRLEDERKPFSDWIGNGAKTHPLLSPHFTSSNDQPAPTQPVKPSGPILTPEIARMDANTQAPASPQGRMTPSQIRDYFSSREYRILSADDKKVKQAELMISVGKK